MSEQQFEVFGVTDQGEPVQRVSISGGGLTAHVMTWGAVIQDLRLEGHAAPLVLGFDNFDAYPKYSAYFGATPGRCANRIGAGRFTLDGRDYQLECNEGGVTHLHGGSDGIGRRNWKIVSHESDKVVLQIVDADGRAGYPGNCTVTATYAVKPGGILSVVYETASDQPTPANVCQHSYFNLDGSETVLAQELMIAADHVLAVDGRQVPTGVLAPVEGTGFDLRQSRTIGARAGEEQVLYDHNFCLSGERQAKRPVARAHSPQSGVTMDVHTTEPGVQFYAGVKLKTLPVPGLDGKIYGPFAGFCLETQVWPDAINHSDFPNAVLRPGETLRQETDYIFSKN